MHDVRNDPLSIDHVHQRHSAPRNLVLLPRNADNTHIRHWRKILDYPINVIISISITHSRTRSTRSTRSARTRHGQPNRTPPRIPKIIDNALLERIVHFLPVQRGGLGNAYSVAIQDGQKFDQEPSVLHVASAVNPIDARSWRWLTLKRTIWTRV